MKRLFSILISSSLVLSSCAPKVTERDFKEPKRAFAEGTKDTRVSLRVRQFNEAPPEMTWQGEAATSDFFAAMSDLATLGESTGRVALKNKSVQWLRDFYVNPNSAGRLKMQQTPFAALATAQTQEQVTTTLDEVLIEMTQAKPLIRKHVLGLANTIPTELPEDLHSLLGIAEDFSAQVIAVIPEMGLSETIEKGLLAELIKITTGLFTDGRVVVDQLLAAKTLSESIAVLDQALIKFKVEVPAELQQSLLQGRKIAKGLDKLYTPQAGLTVLVDIWRILTPRERMAYFKPANETLYNFLVKQDNQELECLRTDGCNGGLIGGITKKVFILPKIKEYGLTTLRNEMNKQTREFVLTAVTDFAKKEFPHLAQTFASNIETGIDEMAGRITRVRNDYSTYVENLFKVWGPKILPESEGTLAGFETDQVNLLLSNRQESSITPVPKETTSLKGDLAGTSLLANALLIEEAPENDRLGFAATLSQVNKLVAISGYRDAHNNLIPALLAPVAHKDKLLDIMDFDSSKDSQFSFRLPDVIQLKDSFHADPKMIYEKNFSAQAYIHQLNGLSATLRLTSDWKKSNFDHFVGGIQAQDLTQDAEHDELKQSLFPKDMLFALNLGNAAVLLQDATKATTPVFLLTLQDKVMWADKYADATNETAIMAGIVDIVNGKKSDLVQTQQVAQFLLAIDNFLNATEGVENTKSPILLQADSSGERPLDTLITGKQDLKLLVVALGNYLSHQLLKENSLAKPTWSMKKGEAVGSPLITVRDQALTIQALIKAYDRTGIEAYLWSAKEIYFAMNKHLFNRNAEFYLNGDKTALSFQDKVTTLLAMQSLRPHLTGDSLWQLDKIMEPWLNALSALN